MHLIPNMWPGPLAPEKSVIGLIDKWSRPYAFGRPFEGGLCGSGLCPGNLGQPLITLKTRLQTGMAGGHLGLDLGLASMSHQSGFELFFPLPDQGPRGRSAPSGKKSELHFSEFSC